MGDLQIAPQSRTAYMVFYFIALVSFLILPTGALLRHYIPTSVFQIAAVVGVFAGMVGLMLDPRHAYLKIFEAVEEKAAKEGTLVDYVDAQLEAAVARQELAVQIAETRANNYSVMGTVLMIVSVVVPFLLVAVYLNTPPIAAAASAAPQRDWHLLLAGVSFGLLFIAAARGLLLAEGRQREVYAREVQATAYYGDLRRALGMAQRLDRESPEETNAATREVVQKIITLMLERRRDSGAPQTAETHPAGEHEFIKLAVDTFKK